MYNCFGAHSVGSHSSVVIGLQAADPVSTIPTVGLGAQLHRLQLGIAGFELEVHVEQRLDKGRLAHSCLAHAHQIELESATKQGLFS